LFVSRCAAHALGDPAELVHREDVETALLAPGDDKTTGQTVPELGRQKKAALVVEPGSVRAEEHSAPPSPFDERAGR